MSLKSFNLYKGIIVAVVAALIIISWAAPTLAGWGKTRDQRGYGEKSTLQELLDNWEKYDIYYSGYAINNPSGIIFDLKNDNRILKPSDRWTKIEDKAAVAEVISWIRIQDYPGYYPGLYDVMGSGNELYGYLYSVYYHLFAKEIGGNTMFVYDLPEPPHYRGR